MQTFEEKPLQPAYLKVVRISTAITLLLVATGPAILVTAVSGIPWYWVLACYVSFYGLLLGLFFWYWKHWYKRYRYALKTVGLGIKKGVFWQQHAMIPRNRVQHIDITTGPIERRYDLSKLVVHTAGTSNASVTLPGLLHDDAVALRQELINSNQNEDTV
ncbi:PH domain-containing protein [Marinicella meishanensis]|uniref:PH domain-containing protein n=1 Tax=Marinicella meishanensis TaxID=2873263 RepID=UPI001CBAF1A7|nr:PH domain-containing protein [Marinicella sp. NBU2979]